VRAHLINRLRTCTNSTRAGTPPPSLGRHGAYDKIEQRLRWPEWSNSRHGV